MNQFRAAASKLFSRYLLVTNTLTVGSLLAVGDVITQNIERIDNKDKKHNYARTGRMFCMGFVMGPFNHFWYKVLDRYLPGKTGATVFKKIMCDQAVAAPFFCSSFFMGAGMLPTDKTGVTVFKKIMCDQAIAALFFCSTFFMGMSVLEGKSFKEGAEEVKEKFVTVYLIDWCVWPPAQFINFYFLPTSYRVVYVSTITLFWNTFLSWMKHREQQQQHTSIDSVPKKDS